MSSKLTFILGLSRRLKPEGKISLETKPDEKDKYAGLSKSTRDAYDKIYRLYEESLNQGIN